MWKILVYFNLRIVWWKKYLVTSVNRIVIDSYTSCLVIFQVRL